MNGLLLKRSSFRTVGKTVPRGYHFTRSRFNVFSRVARAHDKMQFNVSIVIGKVDTTKIKDKDVML